MKKEIKDILKEFDKLALKDNPDFYDELDDYKELKSFISQSLQKVIQQERDRIIKEIENYYKDTPIKDIPDYIAFYKAIINQ